MRTPRYHVFTVLTDDEEARLFASYWTEEEAQQAAQREQEFWGEQARVVVIHEEHTRCVAT